MRLRVRDPRLPVVLSAALLGAAIAFPLGVIASHRFSDVPTSNTFHADIDAIADVGVTTGCGVNLYCPKDFVTREQMAAFLNRLGALQAGKTPVVNADRVDGLQASQFARSDVAVGGQTGCTGAIMRPVSSTMTYASVNASIWMTTSAGSFICPIHLPDGATITGFETHLYDNSSTEQAHCVLNRAAWDIGVFEVVAEGPQTSLNGQPGNVVESAPEIILPTVANATYSYVVECFSNGVGTDIEIVGAKVAYTVAGLPIE